MHIAIDVNYGQDDDVDGCGGGGGGDGHDDGGDDDADYDGDDGNVCNIPPE